MSKLEYIEALKRALGGLAPLTIAKTLAYYEQRFIDGVAAGQSEAQVAAGLDDPKKIAMTLRASVHMHAFEQKRNPANLLRMLVSGIGLMIFNLFMVVPALVYGALLACVYVAALCFYVAGIAITASGLSGANELVLGGPLRQLASQDWSGDSGRPMQTKVSISEGGIHVYQEPRASVERDERNEHGDNESGNHAGNDTGNKEGNNTGNANNTANTDNDADQTDQQGVAGAATDADPDGDDAGRPRRASEVLKRAEALAGSGVRITTDTDANSRTAQTVMGLGLVLGGIVLFLISLVITRYTLIGIKRYVLMNISLLKGT